MAATLSIPLSAYKGEDYIATGTHYLPTNLKVPADITDWTIAFTVRAKPGASGAPLLGPIACPVVSGPAGTYTLTLSSAQTTALGVGNYWCDFWRTDAGSQREMGVSPFTILQGVNQ